MTLLLYVASKRAFHSIQAFQLIQQSEMNFVRPLLVTTMDANIVLL